MDISDETRGKLKKAEKSIDMSEADYALPTLLTEEYKHKKYTWLREYLLGEKQRFTLFDKEKKEVSVVSPSRDQMGKGGWNHDLRVTHFDGKISKTISELDVYEALDKGEYYADLFRV